MEQLEMSEQEKREVRAFLKVRRKLKFGTVEVTVKDGRILDFKTCERIRLEDLIASPV